MNILKVVVEKRAIITVDDGTIFRVTVDPPLIEKWIPLDGFVEEGYRLSYEENCLLSLAAAKAIG